MKTLQPGEFLFLQGQQGHELFFLRSGALEVILSPSKPDMTEEDVNNHGTVIERFDQPGQLIGEISPILNCPRTASIRAATECSIQAADMRQGAFENAVRNKPLLGIKIAEEIARRINNTNERLKKHDLRLLRFLEEVRVSLDGFADSRCSTMDTLSQQCVGNIFIGLSRLARMLNTFPPDLPISLSLPYEQAGAFFSFFGGVAFQTPSALTHIAQAADALAKVQGKRFSAGSTLCSTGEEAKELFILLDGRLDVVVGRRSIQTITARGNMVGEMAFLLKTRRTASVIASAASMVLVVPFEKMEPLFGRVPQLLLSMLKQLALRLLQVDSLLQKSVWRNIFFGQVLPSFIAAIRSSAEAIPSNPQDDAQAAAMKAVLRIEEAAATMSAAAEKDSAKAPFTLDELVAAAAAKADDGGELTDTPPGSDSPSEHTAFVMSMTTRQSVFGAPQTSRDRFAGHLGVEPQTLVAGRINGKVGQTSTYAEVMLDSEMAEDGRLSLAGQLSESIGVSHILMKRDNQQWCYYQESRHVGAVSAESMSRADTLLSEIAKLDRTSMTMLEKSRSRRLYLEALTSVLEAHWSAPGKFTDMSPDENALISFGSPNAGSEKHKLDAPPGRTLLTLVDFAKRVVIQLAGGESALMGDVELAKSRLPEKEKQIADLIENRKKACEELQIGYDEKQETLLIQQIEKMAQIQRMKDKGRLTGDSLRDFAATEKETEKMLDERNTAVNQKLKGDAGRKALQQVKGLEDQLRAAFVERMDVVDAIQAPPASDEKKDKTASLLLPIFLLNGFREVMMDFLTRVTQTIQPENMEVAPIMTEGVRLYSGRDVGIALQKIMDRDKLIASIGELPAILRVPGEGYSIYSADWDVLVTPMYLEVDSFQLMAHGVGEWRWSKIVDADKKKYQKLVKSGTVKLDQLHTYFARDYRMLLDEKDIDDEAAKFIREIITSAPAAGSQRSGAKTK